MAVQTPALFETHVHCPDFSLPSVIDGQFFSLKDFSNGNPLVIMFICNHCPYVKAIEDRLIQLAIDLKAHSVNVIAICSNDEISYPDDRLENLKIRAQEKNYSFTYLHDQTQQVAKTFTAVCTPDFFVYASNGNLAYRGRLDDSWKDPAAVTQRELYNAAVELAEKNKISRTQVPSMGCSIKWIK